MLGGVCVSWAGGGLLVLFSAVKKENCFREEADPVIYWISKAVTMCGPASVTNNNILGV